MTRTDVVVIGGGQAGLAMSRCLGNRGIDHVVLERGRVAERWRSERWNSLRLLTPNWFSRLPGFHYDGSDPDGYMTMPEVVDYLERYARSFPAPVQTDTAVVAVERNAAGFHIDTSRGAWRAANVVVAIGHCDRPRVPAMAAGLARDVVQVLPSRYRHPGDLPDGGVLVVGASATGIQLADELHASGRPVTLAVGRHTRLPRHYRGRDILWWFDRMGIFDQTAGDVYDIEVSRRQTSLQLIGRPDHATLDLPTLERRGVRLTGRVRAIEQNTVHLDEDLITTTVAGDARLAQLLARIDRFAAESGLLGSVGEAEPFVPFRWPAAAPTVLDLARDGIRAVVWATGFARRYTWLHLPVLDRAGEIVHRGGVTPEPGLYVLGLHFLRRRKSSFLDGVGADADVLAGDIAGRLGAVGQAVAPDRFMAHASGFKA